MSEKICTIKNTGKRAVKLHTEELDAGADLDFTAFAGPQGRMIQLTQGFGGGAALTSLDVDEVGHIQLTIRDAYETIESLANWIKDETEHKAITIQKQIDSDKALHKTIFKDAVDCQHFIEDLKILKLPLRLLGA